MNKYKISGTIAFSIKDYEISDFRDLKSFPPYDMTITEFLKDAVLNNRFWDYQINHVELEEVDVQEFRF